MLTQLCTNLSSSHICRVIGSGPFHLNCLLEVTDGERLCTLTYHVFTEHSDLGADLE